MNPFLNTAVKAARAAGDVITQSIEHLEKIDIKKNHNNQIVTEVDNAAFQQIKYILNKNYPDHKIISKDELEESSEENSTNYSHIWIIDALDGTLNYINNLPYYAVSIALQVNSKIEMAAIYDPLQQELFSAVRGSGAQLNGKRIRVSNSKANLDHALIGIELPYNTDLSNYSNISSAFIRSNSIVRTIGSSSLNFAYVACNRLNGFIAPNLTKFHMLAGSLIVKEAGGLVSDFQGTENYLESCNIVATNVKLLKPVLQLIN
tara:strand:+ start:42286 stop:43071 length:786 start_codon:yes stop_codon:yes gene_type:complete